MLWLRNVRDTDRVWYILLVAAVAAAVILRTAAAAILDPVPFSDADAYRRIALSLSRGDGYADFFGDGRATAWWVPGWPAVMAAIYTVAGEHDGAVRAVNILLGAVTVVLVFFIAQRLFDDLRVAVIAAAIAAFSPTGILLAGLLMSENLAIPAFLASVLLVLVLSSRQRAAPLVGLAVGLAAGVLVLIREQNLAFVGAVAVYWLVTRSDWRQYGLRVAALSVGCALVVAPWVIRNDQVVGVRSTSTSSGVNLWISLNEGANGQYQFPPVDEWAPPDEPNREAEAYRFARHTAFESAQNDPVRVLSRAPKSLAVVLLSERWPLYFMREAGEQEIFQSGTMGYYGAMAALNLYWWAVAALAALALTLRNLRSGALFLWITVGAMLLPHAIMFGNGRFKEQLVPLLMVLAAASLVQIAEWIQSREGSRHRAATESRTTVGRNYSAN